MSLNNVNQPAANANDEPLVTVKTCGGGGVIKCFVLIALIIATAARVVTYFTSTELMIDEAALTSSIYEIPLDKILHGHFWNSTSAPLGFILVIRWLAVPLGISPMVLWLLPFLASMLTLVCIVEFCRREFDWFVAAAFIGLWALAPTPHFYTAQFKPYALEALFTVLCLLAVAIERQNLRVGKVSWRLLGLAVGGIFFATTATFVLTGIFATFVLWQWRQKAVKNFLIANALKIGLIAAAGLAYYGVFLRSNSSGPAFMWFWHSSFLTADSLTESGERLVKIFNGTTLNLFPFIDSTWWRGALFGGCFIGGVQLLWRKNRLWFATVSLTLATAMAAFLLGVYPLYDLRPEGSFYCARLMLYLFPLLLLPPALVGGQILQWAARRQLPLIGVLAVAAVGIGQWNYRLARNSSMPSRSIGAQSDRLFAWLRDNYTDDALVAYGQPAALFYDYYRARDGVNMPVMSFYNRDAENPFTSNYVEWNIPDSEAYQPIDADATIAKLLAAAQRFGKKRIYLLFVQPDENMRALADALAARGLAKQQMAWQYSLNSVPQPPISQIWFFDLPPASTEGAQ